MFSYKVALEVLLNLGSTCLLVPDHGTCSFAPPSSLQIAFISVYLSVSKWLSTGCAATRWMKRARAARRDSRKASANLSPDSTCFGGICCLDCM